LWWGGRYNLKSFVDICTALRWCPGRHCDKVAMASSSIVAVLCKCGMYFCFKCGEEAHVPATCDDMVSWGEKCKNESETANWILANTKKCPKCMTRIEKNQVGGREQATMATPPWKSGLTLPSLFAQGCNHMSCRQCKHEFCWICMVRRAEQPTILS
jgi:ariadne-1